MTAKNLSAASRFVQKEFSAVEEVTRKPVEKERQARTHPTMLVLVKKNGDELLVSYSLFRHAMKVEGGTRWELVFDDCIVTLTGRNLGKDLSDMLRLQQLSHLREGNVIEDELTGETDAFIESITIDMKEEA